MDLRVVADLRQRRQCAQPEPVARVDLVQAADRLLERENQELERPPDQM
jgi:hypothetical protein